MEKYYVSKDTRFVASHELSVSNSIIEKDGIMPVLNVLKRWVKQIFPDENYIVYYKGNEPNIDAITMYEPSTPANMEAKLMIVHTKCNVRFQIGIYKTEYKIKKAQ